MKKAQRNTITMFIMCLIMVFMLTGCADSPDYSHEDTDAPVAGNNHENHYDEDDIYENDEPDDESEDEPADEPPDEPAPNETPALDTSSAEAFITACGRYTI